MKANSKPIHTECVLTKLKERQYKIMTREIIIKLLWKEVEKS